MLSARELNSESLPNRTWINEQLTFTHGYGLTLGPVNEVTPEGLPILFIKNLPPESTVDLKVAEPCIYFGELSNDHVFVKTNTKEFHYPPGDDNVFAEYKGSGGVAVGVVLAQAAVRHPVRVGQGAALRRPRRRQPRDLLPARQRARAQDRAVPDLRPDPYMAIADGRLYWIQDAYTTSNRYPYSRRHGGGRRSTTSATRSRSTSTPTRHDEFLPRRSRRPDCADLGRIFPGLLRPLDDMPAWLRSGCGTRRTSSPCRRSMFATYHMRQSGGLLQQGRPVGSARRSIAAASGADGAVLHDHEAAGREAAPSSSRCCPSRRDRRTTWRRG